MGRFFLRHWTATLLVVAVSGWGLFYLPNSPTFAVLQLKRAIDAHNGEDAARYIDFQSVVRHAGYEMVQDKAGDPVSQMLGTGAVDLLSKPVAEAAKSVGVKKVNDGDPDVQMPPVAVLGAVVLMRRDGDAAYTRFKDHKNRQWEIRLARASDGTWQISEVKNASQLLEKLRRDEEKRFNSTAP